MKSNGSIGRLVGWITVAWALAIVPLIALDQIAQGFSPPADLAVRLIGAFVVFTTALAVAERLGPFRRKS